MSGQIELSIEESRGQLLEAVSGAPDLTFFRAYGNIGDHLIYAGTRKLLAEVPYREASVFQADELCGHTALLSGGGAWCAAHHAMPQFLQAIEARFERVVVLPSSFDPSMTDVLNALQGTRAMVFARELESHRRIKELCEARLAHDCALYFDYGPYQRRGEGILTAFRTDREASGAPVPIGNNDISLTCESLDEWLWTIARHEMVRTDRAHVTIAAAMLGKRVEYRPSNYHKVPAIIEFSLQGFPVQRLEEETVADDSRPVDSPLAAEWEQGPAGWSSWVRRAGEEIVAMVPPGESFVLVDEDQLGRMPVLADRRVIPFLERDGSYWGPPADDQSGIQELERLREFGARSVIFAWPAFWWLEQYAALRAHLEGRYRRIWSNERLVAFDLRP